MIQDIYKLRSQIASDISALEKQIDEMVYKLYNLTPDEIAIVEGKRLNKVFLW